MDTALERKQRLIDLNRCFGIELAEIRIEHGVKQEDVSNFMHFDRSLVSRIESGSRYLSAVELYNYALALRLEDPMEIFARIVRVCKEYDGGNGGAQD